MITGIQAVRELAQAQAYYQENRDLIESVLDEVIDRLRAEPPMARDELFATVAASLIRDDQKARMLAASAIVRLVSGTAS